MTENINSQENQPTAATPVIKQRRRVSIVWLIPLVAVVIGGWLVYKAVSEKGPEITITFQSATGLEAGKTKVKFKNVDVGVVKNITIGKQLESVVLTVELEKGAEPYLTDKTQFWVVRARINASNVSGLDTLLAGAYLGIEPSSEGQPTREFTGLELPPIVSGSMKGKRFSLTAPRLGSLNPGSPVYFRQIHVGQVVDYKLNDKGQNIGFDIFVESPYDQFVRHNSKFWISSGLDLELTANGLQLNTESFVSMLIGGIAFNTLAGEEPGPVAEENDHFKLYESREQASDDRYRKRHEYYVEFTDSVRGLSIGAPLEFRGFRIGSVVDIELKTDLEKLEFSTMVRIGVERERIYLPNKPEEELNEEFRRMIEKGFRAQLETGNLLTGQLFVKLEIFDNMPLAPVVQFNGLPVIPSVPAPSKEILKDVARFVKKLDNLPLEAIGKDLQSSLAGVDALVNGPDLKASLRSLKRIATALEASTKTINSQTLPQVNAALKEVDKVINDIGSWVDVNSPLYDDVRRTLEELSGAARSINDLADLLERHPEALIQGKASEGR